MWPKVKKKQNMEFDRDTVRERLQVVGLDLFPITLDKGSVDVMVSRDFMSGTYGGSMQATCPSIGRERFAEHGMNDFVYLHLDYQPMAPQVPGAPGLFFSTSGGNDWDGIQRVFTRITSNTWQYMGMYSIKHSPSLTEEEWAVQTQKVRLTWGREICRQQWGGDVCGRVRARKELGRRPTKAELQEVLESGRHNNTTPEEVIAAYDRGDEHLSVWVMKCVAYDNAFQLQLCEKFPNWVAPQRKSRKPKTLKPKKEMTRGSATKRKRERSESSDRVKAESEEEEAEDEETWESGAEDKVDESGMDVESTYIPHGTRSRPIIL
ncbi:hypothetical protein B0H34DRAFT_210332 [Crassisporium funariophilum]|nr:hypothetical protein B0H34DRAFT_210332 [Crassisporium funariophilum]